MFKVVDHDGLNCIALASSLSSRDFKGVEPILLHCLSVMPNALLIPNSKGATMMDEALYSKNNELLALLFHHERQRYFSSLP